MTFLWSPDLSLVTPKQQLSTVAIGSGFWGFIVWFYFVCLFLFSVWYVFSRGSVSLIIFVLIQKEVNYSFLLRSDFYLENSWWSNRINISSGKNSYLESPGLEMCKLIFGYRNSIYSVFFFTNELLIVFWIGCSGRVVIIQYTFFSLQETLDFSRMFLGYTLAFFAFLKLQYCLTLC